MTLPKDQRRREPDMTTDITKCVHCHKCRDNCAFLAKYNIDIGDADRLRELAYSCFLCGTCTSVCPAGIDGRAAVMEFRKVRTADGTAGLDDKGYRTMLWEKKDYRFRNYRHAGSDSVLFPGCNFPSVYPLTMKKLEGLMKEAGIGTVYDCCGKPVAELGLADDEARIIGDLNKRLNERGIREVILVCPNCYYFLRGKIDAEVVSIYDKLQELGIGSNLTGGRVYMPCPDRQNASFLESIRGFCPEGIVQTGGAQCCGLGGSAGVKEPELAAGMRRDIIEKCGSPENAAECSVPEKMAECSASGNTEDRLYVYCASCAGSLVRGGAGDAGISVVHVLTEILGTGEKPDTGKSALNRALTKFK